MSKVRETSRWPPGFWIGYLGISFENVPNKVSGGLLFSIFFQVTGWNQEKKKKHVTNRFGEVLVNCIYFLKDHIFGW